MTSEKLRILIVDDEPNIIMSLDFLIRKAGYQLYVARNGEEAMEAIAKHLPHLVVLDIMMPDIDGFEVCRRIKSNKTWEKTKIIFLSAKSRAEDKAKGMALGADDYITKPFQTKFLMGKIRELVLEE
jgi:DNA-binding response OmpR family regulator